MTRCLSRARECYPSGGQQADAEMFRPCRALTPRPLDCGTNLRPGQHDCPVGPSHSESRRADLTAVGLLPLIAPQPRGTRRCRYATTASTRTCLAKCARLAWGQTPPSWSPTFRCGLHRHVESDRWMCPSVELRPRCGPVSSEPWSGGRRSGSCGGGG